MCVHICLWIQHIAILGAIVVQVLIWFLFGCMSCIYRQWIDLVADVAQGSLFPAPMLENTIVPEHGVMLVNSICLRLPYQATQAWVWMQPGLLAVSCIIARG